MNSISKKEFVLGICSFLSMYAGSVLAHEYSHLTAMRALFTNINPFIGCDLSGFCFADWGGKYPILRPELPITFETAEGITSAAGPISDITVVALSSLIAWKTRQSNKKISLLFAAFTCFFAWESFYYAASTLGTDFGDFAEVESYLGISHIFQTAVVCSVALGTTMLMKHILFSENTLEANRKIT
jgi:hypothetical protein